MFTPLGYMTAAYGKRRREDCKGGRVKEWDEKKRNTGAGICRTAEKKKREEERREKKHTR